MEPQIAQIPRIGGGQVRDNRLPGAATSTPWSLCPPSLIGEICAICGLRLIGFTGLKPCVE
jgi:hypothetical protein